VPDQGRGNVLLAGQQIAGVEVDRTHREIYAVNNDVEDRIAVFDYDTNGDLTPKRRLYVPHQSWGLSLNTARDELVISVQQLSLYKVCRRIFIHANDRRKKPGSFLYHRRG
jgi:hypothetical protein